ncbi:preprotein translocase subunit SecD [Caloranaerobacter azorensis H53214]|uniref:Protein translocase subunit SecD n=1 Tax=Caloranaerobacter azorensis H53214 TaxID=1156417 RepID=A0A096BK05_9FIRM|nr:protein translocase subunit SecD [Caloranaerobacter azorensis]KGG81515.1 preprotein translocase subunit SecD [Caloranaerobacter azorensis H53214]
MNFKNIAIFLLIIALVGFISYSAIYGVNLGKYKITPVKESMKLGLDLEGGVFVVLEAQTDAQGAELERIMEQAKAIIRQRVDGLGVAEPNIVLEGKKRIRIELPGVKNAQDAIDIIGKTAQLQFVDPKGNVVVTGKNIKRSEVTYQLNREKGREEPVVALEFDKEGAKNFAEATRKLIKNANEKDRIIYIVLDDEVISSPVVNSAITDGKAVITGNFTVEEAGKLATLIRAGALPVEMKEVQTSVIGPTLGLESLDKSIYAARIGLILIFLFMLIYYRIPGLIADISLTIYILLLLGTMIYLDATLTLPGIAGLILSIGMAVDANVVIFERIKEEIRSGKTLRAAVDSGFKRALRTVIDANVTTFIAGIVLFKFGTGPIKGFAVTLLIGLVASMITAVFITKYLLKLTIKMNITKNTKLYGA